MKYAIMAAKKGIHFFTEVSVVDDGMRRLIGICKSKKIVAAPSCTMRFHPAVQRIQRTVATGAIGRPLAYTYHSGQYLPEWHPWEDYRKFYAAKRKTGAAREIVPFELVWLSMVFGRIETISCIMGKVSSLEAKIDDVYQIISRSASGVMGHMLVDAVARVPYRTFRLLGDEGVLEWDWSAKSVRVYTSSSKKWEEHTAVEGTPEEGYIRGERMYEDEMARFIQAIRGEKPYPYTFEEDLRILSLLRAAERSSNKGIHVRMGRR